MTKVAPTTVLATQTLKRAANLLRQRMNNFHAKPVAIFRILVSGQTRTVV